jgi:uncharacterized protein (TIGR02118 family)
MERNAPVNALKKLTSIPRFLHLDSCKAPFWQGHFPYPLGNTNRNISYLLRLLKEDDHMAKIIIIYPTPTNKEQFDKLYFKEHLPLAKQVQGIKNTVVNKVVQNVNLNQPFYLIVELEFENLDELLYTTATPEWEKVGEDAKRLTPYLPEPPAVCICES